MQARTGGKIFVLGDADDVRKRMQSLLLSNRLDDLRILSSSITSAIHSLGEIARDRMGADIIVCGGDDILFAVSSAQFQESQIQEMMRNFSDQTGLTISFGVGESTEDAFLSLARAKARGPSALVIAARMDRR